MGKNVGIVLGGGGAKGSFQLGVLEALLKKSGGKWYIMELSAFSTDVWWEDLWNRYRLPRQLFFK